MRAQIEEELEKICHDILKLLEDKLIKEANAQGAAEARVFYNKMKGDYYRYLAEFQDDEAVKEVRARARARGTRGTRGASAGLRRGRRERSGRGGGGGGGGAVSFTHLALPGEG